MSKLQTYLLNKIEKMNEEELRNELKHVIETISDHELADIYVGRVDFDEAES